MVSFVVISQVVGDFCIYWYHRWMHAVPFLLRNVHGVHHGYRAVYSWAGGILHPMEDVSSTPLCYTQVMSACW